jgi:hypothetical protein
MKLDLRNRHIDHNHFRVTSREAKLLVKEVRNHFYGKLPKHGYETLVVVNDTFVWLRRTVVKGKQVWCVHSSSGIPL